MISLFGPQHGRIIQANYDGSGKLQVYKTKCFDFMTRKDEGINFCLRFILSKPRARLKLEFPDPDGSDSNMENVAPKTTEGYSFNGAHILFLTKLRRAKKRPMYYI